MLEKGHKEKLKFENPEGEEVHEGEEDAMDNSDHREDDGASKESPSKN